MNWFNFSEPSCNLFLGQVWKSENVIIGGGGNDGRHCCVGCNLIVVFHTTIIRNICG